MNKILAVITAALVILLMSGCGGKSEDPRIISDKFTEAFIVKLDPDEMIKYVDDDGAEEMQEQFLVPRREAPELYGFLSAGIKDMKLRFVRNDSASRIEDDEATIFYDLYSDRDPNFENMGYVELEKDGLGRWRVHDWSFEFF